MQVLRMLRSAISDCARVISFGAKIQEPARKEFVSQLAGICGRCDDTYSDLLKHLQPIKANLADPEKLAQTIREFAGNGDIRKLFKPERLCGEIDDLLTRLQSNLDPLKYSLEVTRINAVRDELHVIGNYDAAIRTQFDKFVSDLDALGSRLAQATGQDKKEFSVYAQNVVTDFETELKETVAAVREAKNRVVR